MYRVPTANENLLYKNNLLSDARFISMVPEEAYKLVKSDLIRDFLLGMRSLERGLIFYGNEQPIKMQISEQQTEHLPISFNVGRWKTLRAMNGDGDRETEEDRRKDA